MLTPADRPQMKDDDEDETVTRVGGFPSDRPLGSTASTNELASAALVWHRSVLAADRVRDERNAIECERRAPDAHCYARAVDGVQIVNCWQLWKEQPNGEGFDRDAIPMWCGSCQRRQALTDELRKLRQRRGARLRNLRRLCRLSLAMEQPPAVDAVARSGEQVTGDVGAANLHSSSPSPAPQEP